MVSLYDNQKEKRNENDLALCIFFQIKLKLFPRKAKRRTFKGKEFGI